jgi:hypothetical protein
MATEKQELVDQRSVAGAMILLTLLGLFYISFALPPRIADLKFELTAVAVALCLAYMFVGAIKNISWIELPILSKLAPVHFVQGFVQSSVLLFLSFYSPVIGQQVPLILFQLLFALNFDMLCSIIFYRSVRLNLAAVPIVMSFNLFLWFRPNYFLLQLGFIALGVLSKYLFRWVRHGKLIHIFNPSAIAMFFGTLLVLYWEEISAIGKISNAYSSSRPYVFMFVFLVGLISITLGRVALVTFGTVLTMFVIDQASLLFVGEPLMTTWISPSLLVGMTLLVTDPATTPKGPRGQFLYGVAYAFSIVISYGFLSYIHCPGYYSKIIGLPFLNLAVRWFDRLDPQPKVTDSDPWDWSNVKFSALYAAIFIMLYPSMIDSVNRTSVFGRFGGDEWAQKHQR